MKRFKAGLLSAMLFVNTLQGIEAGGAEPVKVNSAPESLDVVEEHEVHQKTSISKAMTKTHTICLGKFKITAYCPCQSCSGGYGRKTSTGKMARANHTVAVDPRVIRYGTKLRIGGKVYVAEDCGGGVKGKHIDIYFNNHSEVDRFGKKYRNVEELMNGN